MEGINAFTSLRQTVLDQIDEDGRLQQVDPSASRSWSASVSICCRSSAARKTGSNLRVRRSVLGPAGLARVEGQISLWSAADLYAIRVKPKLGRDPNGLAVAVHDDAAEQNLHETNPRVCTRKCKHAGVAVAPLTTNSCSAKCHRC